MSALCESTGARKLLQCSPENGPNRASYREYWGQAYNRLCSAPGGTGPGELTFAFRALRQAGDALPLSERTLFEKKLQHLGILCRRFAKNVFDATRAWTKNVSLQELSGLPPAGLAAAAKAAEAHSESGYLITLDDHLYNLVMTHADHRPLRREVYEAFYTRASETGPGAKHWNNSQLMADILATRHQLAQMLGLANYAEYAIKTKIVAKPLQVVAHLTEMAEKSLLQAMCEFAELTDFAREKYRIGNLEAWDMKYISEKLRWTKHPLSQESLRPYFPAERVIDGLFSIVNSLYGMEVYQQCGISSDWRYYLLFKHNTHIASFYLNLCARQPQCQVSAGSRAEPVAQITCNFTPPSKHHPFLLNHEEVITLFREFGQGLYQMLNHSQTRRSFGNADLSRDCGDLTKDIFEHWCWRKEVIPLISCHYVTAEPLPESLLGALRSARNFQSGMRMLEQLEPALFDLRMHFEYDNDSPRDPQALLNEIRHQLAIVVPPNFNRFQHSFGSAFAGDHAASCYSHLWSQMLACDAFSLFEDKGVFDRESGEMLLRQILAYKGTRSLMRRFIDFRGRAPKPDALLRHCGIGFV